MLIDPEIGWTTILDICILLPAVNEVKEPPRFEPMGKHLILN